MPAGFFISEIPGVIFIIAHKLLLLLVVVRYLGSLTKKNFQAYLSVWLVLMRTVSLLTCLI